MFLPLEAMGGLTGEQAARRGGWWWRLEPQGQHCAFLRLGLAPWVAVETSLLCSHL